MRPDDPILSGCGGCAAALREAPRAVRRSFAGMLLGLVSVALLSGTPTQPPVPPVPPAAFDHEHTAWTTVLTRFVTDGWVDYRGLSERGQPALNAYLDTLAAAAPMESGWSRPERMAFWINAYNAFTIRLILDHYPLKSIRSIGFLPLAAFRTKFIPLGPGRTKVSLNTIENDVLRPQSKDARVHFAIVCASKSCPALRSEAYRAGDLDRQLDAAAQGFLTDSSKNRWDGASRTLYLSSIFKWYRDDFEREDRTLPAFVSRYIAPPPGSTINAPTPRIVFLDYDWSLNGK